MRFRFRALAVMLPLLGCGSTHIVEGTYRCVLEGSFEATDCAVLLVAARDAAGNPLGLLPIRVDSMIPSLGFAYLSESELTAVDGGFILQVFRVNRFEQQAMPDTATVYVNGYAETTPAIGATPIARAAVVMRFAPVGDAVPPTTGIATFLPLP
jgi:hypothetical protein